MHIVVIGAGTVGTSIAEMLCADQHNVVLVDSSREALNRVEEKIDVQTVHGSGCEAIPLFQAGVQSADLVLAVTDRDELNVVGASLSKAMGARRTVVRIFNPAYRDFSTFDYQRHFRIDRLLSLEHLTALELAKGIRAPGLFAIENFARGGVHVQEVAVEEDAKAVGKKLRNLALPSQVRVRLISILRGHESQGLKTRLKRVIRSRSSVSRKIWMPFASRSSGRFGNESMSLLLAGVKLAFTWRERCIKTVFA
ncbi:MAG: NAD-binding protein [Planctomycetaceae bacterium]